MKKMPTTSRKKERGLYAPARRLLDVRKMLNTAAGVSVYEIADELGICVRTAIRYLEALEAAGEPVTQEREGRRKLWKLMLSARHEAISFTTSQMLALSLTR